MELSKEQQTIVNEVIKLKQLINRIAGFAGTGKSFLIPHILERLPNFAVCAPTGRAAQILRSKGVENASTIHSLIYKPKMDSYGNIILDKNGSPIFILNPDLPYEGIIADESSMISKELYEDLLSFGIPLICLGDSGQLPPVGNEMNLMDNPDFTLETIHRNAGEIAY